MILRKYRESTNPRDNAPLRELNSRQVFTEIRGLCSLVKQRMFEVNLVFLFIFISFYGINLLKSY